jgi:ABC-type branched-subunit amino acid transport system substrate-binding protein
VFYKKSIRILFFVFCLFNIFSVQSAEVSNSTLLFEREVSSGKLLIPINTSFPTFGSNSRTGKQMLSATKGFLKLLNRNQHFKFILCGNNPYSGKKALERIKYLKKRSPIFVGLFGTDTAHALIPLVEKKEIVLLFPSVGTQSVRQLNHKNIIYLVPTHKEQFLTVVDYLKEKMGVFEASILYEASLLGRSVLESLQEVLDNKKIKIVSMERYAQGTVNITRAAFEISKKSPHAIFVIARPWPAYNFVKEAVDKGLHSSVFIGLYQIHAIQRHVKETKGVDIVCTSIVPNTEKDVSIPLVQEYRRDMKEFLSFRKDEPFYFEAYLGLCVFEEALRRIVRPDTQSITIEQIISTIESFKDFDFKGIRLDFRESDRSLLTKMWINPGVKKDWIEVNLRGGQAQAQASAMVGNGVDEKGVVEAGGVAAAVALRKKDGASMEKGEVVVKKDMVVGKKAGHKGKMPQLKKGRVREVALGRKKKGRKYIGNPKSKAVA